MRSGQVIANRYRLVELIGSGGSGLVWLAEDEQVHRQVALKRPHGGAGAAMRAELEREAGVAARVAHPGAVAVFEVAGDDHDAWLVMEYFPAANLGEVMRRRGPLEPLEVARIGVQVADALAAIHHVEVVHRDVTPNNLLLDADGTAKVTDYGISAHRASTMTSSGKISGTAAYLSPEVANGNGAKAPSDVFSLGASLFAAVEGEPPFGVGDPDMILARIRAGRRAPIGHAGPLTPVLEAMLHTDRDARPTAAQARDMLAKVVAGEPVPAWRPGPSRRTRRRWALAAGGVVVAAVVVAGLLPWSPWSPWSSSADDTPPHTVLGDPRTADPCSLADPKALSRFGSSEEDRHYGNFDRCDVLINEGDHDNEGDDDEVGVTIVFDSGPTGSASADEVATLSAPSTEDDACGVVMRLADGTELDIYASPHSDTPRTDLCAIAKAAGDAAFARLPDGELARRRADFAPDSLARAKACGLLDDAALAKVGLSREDVQPGFADWQCEWSKPASPTRVRVQFDQGARLSAEDGQPIRLAGRDAFVQPGEEGDSSCVVPVVHRPFTGEDDDDLDEIAKVIVNDHGSADRICGIAVDVARVVAKHLPPA